MKKVFLTAAIILGGLSTYTASAVTVNHTDGIVIAVQEEYKLDITVNEVASTVYADKEGNWIEKE